MDGIFDGTLALTDNDTAIDLFKKAGVEPALVNNETINAGNANSFQHLQDEVENL